MRDEERERAWRTTRRRHVAEIDEQLEAGRQILAGEPDAEIDGRREVEPARRIACVLERAIELVDAAGELRRLEIRRGDILPERLQRVIRVRRRAGRVSDVTLEVIDHEAEPIAQAAERIGELVADLDRDVAAELGAGHRLLVSKNHVSFTPPWIRPCA